MDIGWLFFKNSFPLDCKTACSNTVSDWMAAVLPSNQKPCKKRAIRWWPFEEKGSFIMATLGWQGWHRRCPLWQWSVDEVNRICRSCLNAICLSRPRCPMPSSMCLHVWVLTTDTKVILIVYRSKLPKPDDNGTLDVIYVFFANELPGVYITDIFWCYNRW